MMAQFRAQKKKTKKNNEQEKTVSENDELNDATKPVVTSILKVLKQNQLLDKALCPAENAILSTFFTNGNQSAPSEEILKTLDKAMTISIGKLINKPHELDDIIDNKMRNLLILHTDTAKTLLLEMMLADPHFIPVNWSGNVLCSEASKMKQPHPKTPYNLQ